MKRYVSALLFGLVSCGVVQAAAIDLNNHQAAPSAAAEVSAALPSMSELPEPEVLAMMVVGLILIGYKATRHSSEKFK